MILPALKNDVFPMLFPFGTYKAYFSPIGVESLAFGQTSKLRFEITLIDNICTSKLCNTTPGS